jgi:hypothetical protein
MRAYAPATYDDDECRTEFFKTFVLEKDPVPG